MYLHLWILIFEMLLVPGESQFAVQARSGTRISQSVKVNTQAFQVWVLLFFFELQITRRTNVYTFYFTECPLGYHSFNCSVACKFPSFGDDCQYLCNCTESSCDHKFGCKMFIGKWIKIINNINIKKMNCIFFLLYSKFCLFV